MSPPPVLVLAGGLGTRLRSVVADRPKVLAPVAGRPFLDHLVARLHAGGTRRIVLLVGHLHEQVERHVAERLRPAYPGLEIGCSVEPAPLGTAGALRHAAALRGETGETFMVLNGDTWFELDTAALIAAHRRAGDAIVTLAARVVPDSGRYGGLDVSEDGRVRGFFEKDPERGRGLINAGAYVMEPRLLEHIPPGRAVSLEHETFPRLIAAGERLQAVVLGGHFVDIGTAESYAELESYLGNRKGT